METSVYLHTQSQVPPGDDKAISFFKKGKILTNHLATNSGAAKTEMDNFRWGIYWIPEQPNFTISTYVNMYILPSDPNIEQSLNFRFLILAACSLWFFFSFKFHLSDRDYLNINCLSGILTGDGSTQWTRRHGLHDDPVTYCWGLMISQSTKASHTVIRARREMSRELTETNRETSFM